MTKTFTTTIKVLNDFPYICDSSCENFINGKCLAFEQNGTKLSEYKNSTDINPLYLRCEPCLWFEGIDYNE